jgi:hypothetical protein
MGNNPLTRLCLPAEADADCDSLAFNRVELAATELFSVGIATAYHTSVLVNGEEFFFTDSGIFTDRALNSHQQKPSERVQIGFSDKTGTQLMRALQPFFKPGTYDFLRKNCNSFSDCALYYLLRRRLDWRYSALDRLGAANNELCTKATKGLYTPNPEASEFNADDVLSSIASLEDLKDEPIEDDEEGKFRSCPALSIGSQVTIVALTNATHLNGQGATIERFSPVNGRWEAFLHMSGETKAFRAENLRPAGEVVFQSGDQVRIRGLKSENGQALNGKSGEIIRYLHDVSRYEVKLSDITKAVKPENLQGLAQQALAI